MTRVDEIIRIKNAQLPPRLRNFTGKESDYNTAGERNFGVLIETEMAHRLLEDGWNIRWLQPRDDQDEPQAFLPVKVAFRDRNGKILPKEFLPRIVLVTNKNATTLSEQDISILDWAELTDIDLVIRPYNWSMPGGRSGVKAYLKDMGATRKFDDFEEKYMNVPDSAETAMCEGCQTIMGSCKDCPLRNDEELPF